MAAVLLQLLSMSIGATNFLLQVHQLFFYNIDVGSTTFSYSNTTGSHYTIHSQGKHKLLSVIGIELSSQAGHGNIASLLMNISKHVIAMQWNTSSVDTMKSDIF